MEEIKILNPKIAKEYMKLNWITLRRDLDMLVEKELLIVDKNKFCANYKLLNNFYSKASVQIMRHY